MIETKKRRAPISVPSVEVDGLRYEAPIACALYGFQHDGGVVVARDARTQELLWTRRVYAVPADASIEADKQDSFITKMTLSPDKAALMIEDESGDAFRLHLTTMSVEQTNKK